MKKALTIFISLSAVSVCVAAGLSTRFSDIEVFDVPVGRRIVIPGPERKSMRLKNLSDTPVRITFHVDQPSPRELRADMEPLPDLRWVQLSPNAVEMAPRGEADVRVSVRVPRDRRHRGKHYQFMVWSRSDPSENGKLAISAGLRSRVRLYIVP